MQAFVVGPLRASIGVTLQNRPWEWLSLEVEGEDPDWVSSTELPLDALLSGRESRPVRFFRNVWTRSVLAVMVWGLFIPPMTSVLGRLSIDPLISVVAALLPVGAVSALYQRLTKPVIITSVAPSTWRELGRVVLSAAVAGAIRFALDGLAKLAGSLRP
jgi:hypothetical protein